MVEPAKSEMIYGLETKPGPLPALFTAIQHVLASVVGVVTPPLIIGSVLGLNAYLPYLISMSLLVSGIGTFIQSRRFYGVGAGMLCLQGTSFAFLSVTLAAGFAVKSRGGSAEDILSMIFGINFVAAFVPIILSRFIGKLRRVITPLITGIVITLIGISLIKVSIVDWGGGHNAPDFGAPINLVLGGVTLLVILVLSRINHNWIRLSAVVFGIIAGCLFAYFSGQWRLHPTTDSVWIEVPKVFHFGFSFDWALFVPIALISAISIIEAVGDITANCMLSQVPIDGESYIKRLEGGVLADGVSCAIAAVLGAFPTTTFAQNNGVIQMTGVASRYVGLYIGAILILLGVFPLLSHLLQQLPTPVLGGATLLMFGSVAAAGIRIISHTSLTRRDMLIIAVSFGIGLGIEAEPDFLQHLPKVIQNMFGSAITSGGIIAIILNLFLPHDQVTSVEQTQAAIPHVGSEI